MWPFRTPLGYAFVEQKDDEQGSIQPEKRPLGCNLTVLIFIAVVAFLVGSAMSSAATAVYFHQVDSSYELAWSPNLNPKTQWIKFMGRSMEPSPYRGRPSQSVDDAWNRYTWNKWFDGGSVALDVTEEAIKRSRKSSEDEWVNSTTRLDAANGGGYLATLKIFHQLHCLVSRRFHHHHHPLQC